MARWHRVMACHQTVACPKIYGPPVTWMADSRVKGKGRGKGKGKVQGSSLPGTLTDPTAGSMLDTFLEMPVHPSVEEKKGLRAKDESVVTSSAASTEQPPKVTKCRSKARIQKKKDTLKLKKKLAKKRKQQEKQQLRIEAASAQAEMQVKRTQEAEEWAAELTAQNQWPPSPVWSSVDSSVDSAEESQETSVVKMEDIPRKVMIHLTLRRSHERGRRKQKRQRGSLQHERLAVNRKAQHS